MELPVEVDLEGLTQLLLGLDEESKRAIREELENDYTFERPGEGKDDE